MREHKKSHLGIMGWAMFLAGAMSLGSCSSDETLESIEREAITFGNVTMENLSRAAADPSYNEDTNPLNQFNVWGTVKGNTSNTVQIFNGASVTNGYITDEENDYGYGKIWTCDVTQYWIPDATYNFMAIANADPTKVTKPNGIPTAIDFELTDGSKDLLLAAPVTRTNNFEVVPFEFSHLLSKVHFTFDGSASNVAEIVVTGHNKSGKYTIGAETPWGSLVTETTSPLSFGGIDGKTSELARLIIPGEQTWTIQLLNSRKEQIGQPLTLNYTAANDNRTSGGFIFAPNTQYNINISLGVDMALAVEVQDWEGVEVPNDFAKNVTVSSGYINWTDVDPVYVNAAGQATTTDKTPAACWVVFDKTKTSATFTFKIDAPMGGTWNAMLVTKQGTSEVFKIVKAGTDEELTSGKVGETYTLTIKTIEANASELANMAELRIMVRAGGEILPANNLVYHGTVDHPLNGKNYIMVQNK